MNIDFENEKPIYIQISEEIEDAILSGAFPEETQVPSTTEISVRYKINPATALKGINILVDEEIVYKKRGLGMFVAQGASEKILTKRRRKFYDNYINALICEAKKLRLSKEDVAAMLERGYSDEHNND